MRRFLALALLVPALSMAGDSNFLHAWHGRQLLLAMNAPTGGGCRVGVDCWGRSLTLSGTLTLSGALSGAAAAYTGTVTAAQFAGSSATTFDGQSSVADGASAVGFTWDATADLATAGAIHTKWRDNATTNLAYLAYDGTLYLPGVRTLGATTLTLTSDVADAGTAFKLVATTNLTSGKLLSLLDNTNTELAYVGSNGAFSGLSYTANGKKVVVADAANEQKIVTGTTTTDVTFGTAFSAAPKCVCSYSQAGAAPDTEDLICVATTTTLDVDIPGAGDPGFNVDFICIGDR